MGLSTAFPMFNDLSHVYTMTRAFCDRHYPLIPYRVLQAPVESEIDDVHDEVPEYTKRWSASVDLRLFALPSDQSHPMTIFSIEELRDVVVFVSVPNLLDVGLATQDTTTMQVTLGVDVGDRFTYSDGVEYDILEWRLDRTFANTDIPLTFQAVAEKVRREADQYAGLF